MSPGVIPRSVHERSGKLIMSVLPSEPRALLFVQRGNLPTRHFVSHSCGKISKYPTYSTAINNDMLSWSQEHKLLIFLRMNSSLEYGVLVIVWARTLWLFDREHTYLISWYIYLAYNPLQLRVNSTKSLQVLILIFPWDSRGQLVGTRQIWGIWYLRLAL